MRALLLVAVVALGAGSASAQAELPKAPRLALKAYLDDAPAYRLLPDSAFFDLDGFGSDLPDAEPGFRPYWRVGDFNDDGLDDLAALLFGPPAQEQRAWGDRTSYESRAVVLHGQPDRTYRVAAEFYGEIPHTSALLQAQGGALGWRVWGTDAVVRLRPDGDGYHPETPFDE